MKSDIFPANKSIAAHTVRAVAIFLLSILLPIAIAVIAGCVAGRQAPEEWLTVTPESRQGDVSVYRDIQFADIPVPEEYILLPRESSSFQGSLFRNAFLVYQGMLDWSLALDFYRNQLPQTGWQLAKTDRGHDFRVLYFAKAQEKLIVVVRQIRNGSRAEIQLDNADKNDLLLKGKLINPGY